MYSTCPIYLKSMFLSSQEKSTEMYPIDGNVLSQKRVYQRETIPLQISSYWLNVRSPYHD